MRRSPAGTVPRVRNTRSMANSYERGVIGGLDDCRCSVGAVPTINVESDYSRMMAVPTC